MRPLIAILISVFLFAGVYGYTRFANSVRRPPLDVQPQLSSREYSVEIFRSFDCIGSSEWDGIPSLHVMFRGKDVIREMEMLRASESVLIEMLDGVLQEGNNVYVKANIAGEENASGGGDEWGDEPVGENVETDEWGDPVAAGADKTSSVESAEAIRILIKNNGNIVVDQTFWKEAGSTSIAAEVYFETPEEIEDEHDHD